MVSGSRYKTKNPQLRYKLLFICKVYITDCSNCVYIYILFSRKGMISGVGNVQLELELIFYVGVCCSIEQII